MNRRTFLETLSGRDQTATPVGGTLTTDKSPLDPFVPTAEDPWDYIKAAHLLRRVMNGPTDAEIREAVRNGPEAMVERILQPFDPSLSLIDYFAWGEPNTGPPEAEGPAYDRWVWDKLGRRDRLVQWWAKTMIDSPVSIQERMTFFWHDHIPAHMGKVEFAEFEFVNNMAIRSYALGDFREMIRVLTKDPAMLTYLDGEINTKSTLNENYARELLELFTVGRVDKNGKANYTQEDVIAAARGLTGWQKQKSKIREADHHSLDSIFWSHLWDDGVKTFLGRTGKWGADDIIDIIFQVRADQVAWFVCEKIYRLLVNLTPDREVVARMAEIFKGSSWNIRAMLRKLLLSAHFYNRENIGCLPKNLLDYYTGLIRMLKLENIPDYTPVADSVPYRDLFFRLEQSDQLPFHPPNVSGWPKGRAWVTPASLVPRIKFARDVARGRVKPIHLSWWVLPYQFDPIAFAKSFPNPDDLRALCDDVTLFFFGVPPSSEEREMLLNTLLDGGREYEWNIDDAEQRADLRIRLFLEALFSLPKFQLY